MNKYHDLDKSVTKTIMNEFKGQIVDSVCPMCNGDILPKENDVVLWQYTHHLNSRSSVERVKEGVLLKITNTKKKYLSDWPSKIGVVKFNGNKTTSRVPIDALKKKDKCQQCNGVGHYEIEY